MNQTAAQRATEALVRSAQDPLLTVLGAGYGQASISGGSFELGPEAVREALAACSTGRDGLGLGDQALLDAGDAALEGFEPLAMQAELERVVAAQDVAPLVVLGGDDSITVGVVRGVRADALLTFDAHHDCRDPADGVTNGTPVRQLIEAKAVRTVVQVGISPFANARTHREWAEANRVSVIEAQVVHREGIDVCLERVFARFHEAERIAVDFDLDVLDRAFAPGAPAAMPGGLTPQMMFEAVQRLGADERVAALSITEHDPARDINQQTARIAALALLHFAAGVATRR